MKIIIHIGPHKTGTTAIQTHLLRNFAARKQNEYWYPNPGQWGPGHAELAWALVGLNSIQQSSEEIISITKTAEDSGVCGILLSSEEFSRAYPDKIGALASALSDHDVHLIVTLNSVARRAVSEWQELVKHEFTGDLAKSLEIIKKRPGLQSKLDSRVLACH